MNLKSFFACSMFLILFAVSGCFASETRSLVLLGGSTASTQVSVLVHNSIAVTARFRLQRDGSDNDFGKRECRFRLISPSGAVRDHSRSIGRTIETFELDLAAAGGGNAVRQWKLEIRNSEPSTNVEVGQAVRGEVEFFSQSSIGTIPAPAKFGLVQSGTETKTVAMPFTGNLTIQANWDTDEFTLENFRLKFELYKGSTLLASDTGYSRDSIILGISASERMKIAYQVKARDFQIAGDWKVKVYGSIKGKVKNIDLKMTIGSALYE